MLVFYSVKDMTVGFFFCYFLIVFFIFFIFLMNDRNLTKLFFVFSDSFEEKKMDYFNINKLTLQLFLFSCFINVFTLFFIYSFVGVFFFSYYGAAFCLNFSCFFYI